MGEGRRQWEKQALLGSAGRNRNGFHPQEAMGIVTLTSGPVLPLPGNYTTDTLVKYINLHVQQCSLDRCWKPSGSDLSIYQRGTG